MPERRRHARQQAEFSCKIRCPRTGRYFAAVTTDLSPGGALLTLETPKPVADGQNLELALRTDGRPIVLRTELKPARVVRSSALLDRHQVVAIAFEAEHAELATLPQAVAA